MRNHDLVSDGFLALTAASLVLLCSSLLALAFGWSGAAATQRFSGPGSRGSERLGAHDKPSAAVAIHRHL